LIDTFGYRIVYDVGHSIDLMLSSIIVNIQTRLSEIEIGETDQPVWNTKSDVFSSAKACEKLRDKKPVVDWHEIVWFSTAIPRHTFIL
jgi:hypothetical protein